MMHMCVGVGRHVVRAVAVNSFYARTAGRPGPRTIYASIVDHADGRRLHTVPCGTFLYRNFFL
jgi:hypothetical protein